MAHALDKDTIKRILHLHQVEGLKASIIAERFGFTAARVQNVLRRETSSNKQKKNGNEK